MKVKVIIYSLQDAHGNTVNVPCAGYDTWITIGGYDENNKYWQYDSSAAMWIGRWIAQNKLNFKVTCKEIYVDYIPEF